MDGMVWVATFAASLGSALVAGAFFAFPAFVLPGLRRMAPNYGISAMQAITVAIRSAPFLLAFFGTALLAAILGIVSALRWAQPDALYLLIGSLLYLNGAIGVTLLRNVPLNGKLAIVNPQSEAGLKIWNDFVPAWSLWNHVRIVSALGAAVLFTLALIRQTAERGAAL